MVSNNKNNNFITKGYYLPRDLSYHFCLSVLLGEKKAN